MKMVKFYTLLFIDSENHSLSINGISGKFEQQMSIFVKCCESLNKSLIYFTDIELIVLTNNKAFIETISKELNCLEIAFRFEVPKDIRFFAAHYKIDVINFFANLIDTDYSILIDCDVLCVNEIPVNLTNCIKRKIPVYYDITEQVYSAYSRETIISSKKVLMLNELSIGMWAGGEFIGGDNSFFKLLYDEIALIKDKYIDNYKKLHHQGDEALVSSAIEKIMQTKYICNVGTFGGIGRYWSVQTLHVQNPWKSYVNDFLLHLPADKKFIATIGSVDSHIIGKYKNYLRKTKILRSAKTIAKIILRKIDSRV